MLLDEAVSLIQHFNTLIHNSADASHRQRLITMKQNIISEFISAEERRHHRKEPNVQARSSHTLLSTGY